MIKRLVESIITHFDKDLASVIQSGYEVCFENFTAKLSTIDKANTAKYRGKRVVWYGTPGKMIAIRKDHVDGRFGNIYDDEKLDNLVSLINSSETPVELSCSYGFLEKTTIDRVMEEQESFAKGRFQSEYDGKARPASTGDSRLDQYLGSEYLDDIDDIDSDMKPFIKLKTKLAFGKITVDQIKEKIDFDYDALDDYIALEASLKDAIETNSGDIGSIRVQLRDGHHRVFGAIQAGEEYVCVNVADLSGDEINLNDLAAYSYIKVIK